MRYDAIVVGLGGMGSAVLAHCAARGLRVVGIEQFEPMHARGASHGKTRIIRQAYFEGERYVPLLRRSYVLWDELERRTGRRLFRRTGGIFAGTPDCDVVAGTLGSARRHGLAHDVLDAAQLRRRFPQFRLRDGEIAVFESVAGALFPEACVLAHLHAAVEDGARALFGVRVGGFEPGQDGVTVHAGGDRWHARELVVCGGAWFTELVGAFAGALRIERNVQCWFRPEAPGEVAPSRLPIFAVERPEWAFMLYGFPDFGDGVKCAFHHSSVYAGDAAAAQKVDGAEIESVRAALAEWLPAAAGPPCDASVCNYTLTPDQHFIVGRHPGEPTVLLAGGFSGHGFKFCGVIGEVIADLIAEGRTAHDIGMFSPERLLKVAS